MTVTVQTRLASATEVGLEGGPLQRPGVSVNGGGVLPLGVPAGMTRPLSVSELERVVACGPFKGRPACDADVEAWLSRVQVKFVAPLPHLSAWETFCAAKIDDELSIPVWVPFPYVEQLWQYIDAAAMEGLASAGWHWTVLDNDRVEWDDDFDGGFDPLAVAGLPGLIFRDCSDGESF